MNTGLFIHQIDRYWNGAQEATFTAMKEVINEYMNYSWYYYWSGSNSFELSVDIPCSRCGEDVEVQAPCRMGNEFRWLACRLGVRLRKQKNVQCFIHRHLFFERTTAIGARCGLGWVCCREHRRRGGIESWTFMVRWFYQVLYSLSVIFTLN